MSSMCKFKLWCIDNMIARVGEMGRVRGRNFPRVDIVKATEIRVMPLYICVTGDSWLTLIPIAGAEQT